MGAERDFILTEKEACDHRGRNYSDVATSLKTSGTSRNQKMQGTNSPLELSKESWPWKHFNISACNTD